MVIYVEGNVSPSQLSSMWIGLSGKVCRGTPFQMGNREPAPRRVVSREALKEVSHGLGILIRGMDPAKHANQLTSTRVHGREGCYITDKLPNLGHTAGDTGGNVRLGHDQVGWCRHWGVILI